MSCLIKFENVVRVFNCLRNEMKKTNKTSTSAVECLNDDLLEFCILPRLPVSSIMRFKCVSKKWHRMISSPSPRFIRMQFHYASSGILLYSAILHMYNYISKDPGNFNVLKSNDHIDQLGSRIMASCNGLVCIASPIFLKLFIVNPFLKDWKQLTYHCGLSEKFWGMAVDVGETSSRYKLVASKELWINGHTEYEFYVFSSTSERWKVVEKRNKLEVSSSDIGVYVMGSMYWKFRRNDDYVMLRFSLEDEERSLQPLPRGAKDGQIGECGGKLSYTMFREGEIEMWSLDQLQWSKRISFNFENCIERKLKSLVPPSHKMQLRRKKPYSAAYQVIMLPFEGGDVFGFSVDGTVYFYDMRTSEMEKSVLCLAGKAAALTIFPYRNTILPLPEKNGEVDSE